MGTESADPVAEAVAVPAMSDAMHEEEGKKQRENLVGVQEHDT